MLQFFRISFIRRKCIGGIFKKDSQFPGRARYSSQARLKEEDAEEVRIPVPWGHIAGKWWGRNNGIPMLGIHGWQDNAGSFDKLLPHLNVSNFLAIDLPGHGFSSHYPKGKVYTFLEYIYSIRRVVDHFKWDKYSIMGHSLGSALGFSYTAIHKDEVQSLISMECARYLLLAYTEDLPTQLAKGLDKILEYDEVKPSDSAPGYTFDEAINALMEGSLGSVTTIESALALLKRGATRHKASEVAASNKNRKTDLNVFLQHELSKSDEKSKLKINKKLENIKESLSQLVKDKSSTLTDPNDYLYKFTKDPRVKMLQFGLLRLEIWQEMSQNILCPMLSLEGDEGFLRFGSEELYKKGNDIVKKYSKHFEHHVVKGNHHFHLNNPESTAPVINNFLKIVK